MQTKTFNVPNISCHHCQMRIEKALKGLEAVASAKAEVPTKSVNVEWDESALGWDDIKSALDKIGYPPEG